MKRLLLILILTFTFQCWSKADDIRDFQIEGMSVGDSLLDYFTKKEIKESYSSSQYPNKEFIIYYFKDLPKFKIYEAITVAVKANDKNYLIYDIGGSIYFATKFDKCLSKLKEVAGKLNQIFSDAQTGSGKNKHPYDKTGKTISYYNIFLLDSGDNSQVVCLNWSNELEKKGHVDELNLTLGLKEYGDFVNLRAYN